MSDFSYKTHVVNDAIIEAVGRPGWTQARLARALGIPAQTVNKWTQRHTTPDPKSWPAIEQALELPAGTFWALVMGTDAIRLEMLDVAKRPTDINPGAARRFDEMDQRLDCIEEAVRQLVARIPPLPGKPRRTRQAGRR